MTQVWVIEISGYPSGLVNRAGVYDPMEFEAAYEKQIALTSPVDIIIKNLTYNQSTKKVTFDVSATFLANVADARFNAVVVENEVTGTTSGYNQANYYSGGSNGAMGGYEDPSKSCACSRHGLSECFACYPWWMEWNQEQYCSKCFCRYGYFAFLFCYFG